MRAGPGLRPGWRPAATGSAVDSNALRRTGITGWRTHEARHGAEVPFGARASATTTVVLWQTICPHDLTRFAYLRGSAERQLWAGDGAPRSATQRVLR